MCQGKKKKFFLCFLMILLPRQGHSRTLWDTPEMLTGEKLLRAIPTSTQQLPQLPMAVGGISSRPLFWQQFDHGQKLGKTSGSRNCRKYKTKPNQKPKPKQNKTKNRNRFSFSFSWENTKERETHLSRLCHGQEMLWECKEEPDAL